MKYLALGLSVAAMVACGDDERSAPISDSAMDAPQTQDASAGDANLPDSSADGHVLDAAQDAGSDAGLILTELSEQEPNNGDPIEQVNTISVNSLVSGSITEGDSDWFFFDAEPGKIYQLAWVETANNWGRQFSVLDAGRDGDGPGQDYIKVLQEPALEQLEFFAFGAGGHYLAVSSQTGQTGDYKFSLTELAVDQVSGETITFPSTINATMRSPGAVAVHPFEATEGTDIEIRLDAAELPDPSEIDSRIYVFSAETGSWVMRNDDDGVTKDSRVSAPLPKGGSLWLVVENLVLGEPISKLDYKLTSRINPN